MKKTISLQKPKFFLRIFVQTYSFLRVLGVTRLPKIKGLFFYFYRRVKNKKGVVLIHVHNYKMYLDLADQTVSTKLLQHGFWEEGVTNFVKRNILPGMVVVDCGAHTGYYSLLFSKLVGEKGKVYSFEPDPYNFEFLQNNLSINLIKNVTPEKKAVSNAKGFVDLFMVDQDNLSAHTIVKSDDTQTSHHKIEAITIDRYLENLKTPIDLIKMDIEGAESLAIEGMEKTIKNNNLSIITEFHPSMIVKGGNDPKKFIDKLRSLGFTLFIIHPKTGNLELVEDSDKLINICGEGLLNLFCTKTT